MDLSGKFASQITTSKHFYDVTAHRYVEENCLDMGLRTLRGLSADMDDLLTEKGRMEAENFFDQLLFSCQHGLFVTPPAPAPRREKTVYQPVLPAAAKQAGKDVVIVTNCAAEDENLRNMIADFRAALPFESRVVNLRKFPFAGGCLAALTVLSREIASTRTALMSFSAPKSRAPMPLSMPSPSRTTIPIPVSSALTTGSSATDTAP